jgi:hypothetical protein
MKKRLTMTRLGVVNGLTLALTSVAYTAAASAENCSGNSSSFLGFPTWYKYLKPEFVNGECKLNATFPDDIGKVLLAAVEILLRFGGLIAIFLVVYGGFKYIISQGDSEKTKTARQTIVNSMIGLTITLMATLIVSFLGREFTK